jgi:hypothetical protein
MGQVGAVVVHGPASLAALEGALAAACSLETRVAPSVPTDDRSVATGLALGALGVGPAAPDLLHPLRPPLTIRELFPWTVAAGVGAVAFASWHLLAADTEKYETKARRAQTRIDSALRAAKTKPGDLKEALKGARHEAELVSRFIARRVPWSTILRELPEHMPESTVLEGLMGRDQLVLPSPDRLGEKLYADRELSLRGQMRVRSEDGAPDQIDEVNAGVKRFPLLLETFPRHDGAQVMRAKGKGGQDSGSFIYRCGAKRF